MKSADKWIDRIAAGLFGAGTGTAQRAPHPLFSELYRRLHAALDEAELCLHSEVTSRPNRVEVFFDFATWAEYVAPREAQVYRALETEIEAHRRRSHYLDDEKIVLKLFVADPAQHRVPSNHPEIVARRVSDPFAIDERVEASLKHATIIGGRPRVAPVSMDAPDTIKTATPITETTPLAVLSFTDLGGPTEIAIQEAGVLGRGADCDVQVGLDTVSRRALSFAPCIKTGVLEIENLGRWPLSTLGGALAVGAKLRVEDSAKLVWPGDQGFVLDVRAPRRGTLVLRTPEAEQKVVLRAPRTPVRADRSIFGPIDVAFNVDFVDGTGFLVFNNEGSVPLRLGSLEGKQLQWPIDTPRELEAGPIVISIELAEVV